MPHDRTGHEFLIVQSFDRAAWHDLETAVMQAALE